jgi:hypothetical protein
VASSIQPRGPRVAACAPGASLAASQLPAHPSVRLPPPTYARVGSRQLFLSPRRSQRACRLPRRPSTTGHSTRPCARAAARAGPASAPQPHPLLGAPRHAPAPSHPQAGPSFPSAPASVPLKPCLGPVQACSAPCHTAATSHCVAPLRPPACLGASSTHRWRHAGCTLPRHPLCNERAGRGEWIDSCGLRAMGPGACEAGRRRCKCSRAPPARNCVRSLVHGGGGSKGRGRGRRRGRVRGVKRRVLGGVACTGDRRRRPPGRARIAGAPAAPAGGAGRIRKSGWAAVRGPHMKPAVRGLT